MPPLSWPSLTKQVYIYVASFRVCIYMIIIFQVLIQESILIQRVVPKDRGGRCSCMVCKRRWIHEWFVKEGIPFRNPNGRRLLFETYELLIDVTFFELRKLYIWHGRQ